MVEVSNQHVVHHASPSNHTSTTEMTMTSKPISETSQEPLPSVMKEDIEPLQKMISNENDNSHGSSNVTSSLIGKLKNSKKSRGWSKLQQMFKEDPNNMIYTK